MRQITVSDKAKLTTVISRLLDSNIIVNIGVSKTDLRSLLAKVTPYDHKEGCRRWNNKHKEDKRIHREQMIARIRARAKAS